MLHPLTLVESDAARTRAATPDVAIGLASGKKLSALEIGDLVSRLESAAGSGVDIAILDGARPGLAYRVFRNGQTLCEKDHRALLARKVRAILEYLDFEPGHQSGVLDPVRVHGIAAGELGDLLDLCDIASHSAAAD